MTGNIGHLKSTSMYSVTCVDEIHKSLLVECGLENGVILFIHTCGNSF